MSNLMNFMKRIGIDGQLPYANTRVLEFVYNLFDKKTMLEYVNEFKVVVKKEYEQYTIDTLNRFFAVVASVKTEVFQKRYDEDDHIIELVEHRTKNLFLESFEPLSIFIKFWLYNENST